MASKIRGRTALGALWKVFRQARRPGSPGMMQLLSAFPRMLKARVTGAYRGVSYGKLGAIALGIAYILSPIDVLPEALLLVFGLADDALVLAWITGAAISEAEQYLQWEQAGRPTARAQAVGAGVIDGEVVHRS